MSLRMVILKTGVVEDMVKRKHLYIVPENVNWSNNYGEQFGGSPQPKNKKKIYHMIQQFQFWLYTQRK